MFNLTSKLVTRNATSVLKRCFASESNQLALTFSSPYQVSIKTCFSSSSKFNLEH